VFPLILGGMPERRAFPEAPQLNEVANFVEVKQRSLTASNIFERKIS